MTSHKMALLLLALATVTAGCSGKSNRNDSAAAPPPPLPPQASYSVAVTGIDVVNKDTGAAVVVGGLPTQGGRLDVP